MRRRLSHRIVRLLRDTAGTNMIEAAIIAPLLLLLSFSIVDFSGVFYVWLALENGVSQATRLAVTGNTVADPTNPAAQLDRQNSVIQAMRAATPTLTLDNGAFAFSTLVGNTWTPGFAGAGQVGKVSVTYTWRIMTPIISRFFTNGQIQITANSAMKNESFQ
ncbi:MAG TPA: TadE/TadG family type IV pilus assembly protein [Vicinamibacterales bacterium]|jgi:Flp pilus assembly protein TadG